MFTPKSVIYPASANPAEILVAGEDENGRAANAPLFEDEGLAQQIAATPATIDNPAREAAELAYAAAVKSAQADLDAVPTHIENPAYGPLKARAFALAAAAVAAHEELLK